MADHHVEKVSHYLTVGWKLVETTPIASNLTCLVGCTMNWKEVDYARLIRRAMVFGLKVGGDGEKIQLKPQHHMAARVASLARSWTPT